MMPTKFENSITIIRAFCVLGIVLFHIDKSWLPLGFLGVDLFFVLSGFLITSIILNQNKERNFNYLAFYKRRFMRLMPAFYASILLTLFAALIIGYHEVELIELLQSSISSLLFISNFYFWENTGYFVTSTNVIENIHHWSLSVEEQFYFIWPVFLLVVARFFKITHWSFILLAILLTIISIYLSVQYPRPAFYLLPTRAWQFVLGALVIIHIDTLSKIMGGIDKSISLIAIILLISLGHLVPDFAYKIPIFTLSISVLLIIFLISNRSGPILSILENKFVLWVGLASYPIYLVHQPVLAISRKLLRHPDDQSLIFIAIAVTIIIIISAIVHSIEKVFRYRKFSTSKLISSHLFIIAFFSIFLLLTPQYNINSKFADPAKFDYGCQTRDELGCNIFLGDTNDPIKIMLLGNSHARMLLPAFLNVNDDLEVFHPDSLAYSLLGGNEDLAIQIETPEKSKVAWMNKICKIALNYDSVVVSYRYIGYLYKSSNIHISERSLKKERIKELQRRLDSLAECVPHLIIVGQVPELNFWPRNIFRGNYHNKKIYLERDLHEEVSKPVTDVLLSVAEKYENVNLIFPDSFLCDDHKCYASKMINDTERLILYYDDDHLNISGAQYVVSEIINLSNKN